MSEYLNKLVEDLDNVIDENVKLNEEAFKNLYLPYIIGQKHNDNFVVKWIELAGSPFKEVDLVDNEGNIVNTLPPLIKNAINGDDDSSLNNLSGAITEGKLQEDTYGKSAILEKTTRTIANHLDDLQTNKEWVKALKPYLKDTTKVDTLHSSSIDDEDEIELEF